MSRGSAAVVAPPPAVGRDTRPATGAGWRHLFWTWTAVTASAEAVGFLLPAAAGVAAQSLPELTGMVLVLAAGAAEGVFLGAAQQSVLRRVLPRLRRGRWIALTSGAAVLAYLLGFLLAYLAELGTAAVALPFVGSAALLLATIGGAQAVELRHHVRHAGRWVAWTAGAWLVALGAFLVIATPLWHPGQSTADAVAVGAVAGIVMAVVQAAIIGYGLLGLLRDDAPALRGAPR